MLLKKCYKLYYILLKAFSTLKINKTRLKKIHYTQKTTELDLKEKHNYLILTQMINDKYM